MQQTIYSAHFKMKTCMLCFNGRKLSKKNERFKVKNLKAKLD